MKLVLQEDEGAAPVALCRFAWSTFSDDEDACDEVGGVT